MKVNVEMNLSQKDFFDYLTQSLMIDIFKNKDKFKNTNEIKKGLQYKKKFKQAGNKEFEGNVEIIEYVRPESYISKIQLNSNISHIGYEIEKIDDDHIRVTYTETFDSTKKLHVWNYKIISFILFYFNAKKMKKMLIAMEHHILNKEESI